MNKRIRKKQLKKLGVWVDNSELWNLDQTLAEYILPRLKKFQKVNIAYPGIKPMSTFEVWQDAIGKMIRAFELCLTDPLDVYKDVLYKDKKEYMKLVNEMQKEIDEGLELFAKYFQYLWI